MKILKIFFHNIRHFSCHKSLFFIRNLLLNGLFAVFDQLKLRDFRRLHLSMNSSSRILLAELKELHFNDFKYFGKL